MALTELVNALRQQAIKQREREGELLNNIAYLAGLETAEAAADIYAAEKHAYSFDGYLYQLEKLKTVLAAGVPSEIALEAVDSCADADAIIKTFLLCTAANVYAMFTAVVVFATPPFKLMIEIVCICLSSLFVHF